MMFPIENNDTFLLFFHGLDSSNETSKYTCITREPKYCQTVNYRESFAEIFEIYDALIREKMTQYPRVVLAGHSLGGWFANHFAHKYNLRALLIAPCIYPSEVLADRIPDVADMKLSFPTTNTEMVRVMVEVGDESLDVAVARRTLVNLPDSWEVDYFEGGHHRIARSSDIWYHITHLCEDPIVWMDETTYHGED
ncbi:YqiA/YcfP family alpha/beta fold hydrolase [Psychrobacter sp. APC 3279]|uniref:YqiA/YcfP family alpha/beta fold hydrolase n=1 Tax=Psychrobacter sp. APC 3279 TaxID=3035189 RepID=UPI0025B5D48B|nr:YqiA/YcfP family alpha/beta fold hydrolase [Psychrobacter sp. APC 3279]MDN3440031.1 YqiA/YcfP family alpha/beta fold hydrolase [Psychrobacter sp. APC 3279]